MQEKYKQLLNQVIQGYYIEDEALLDLEQYLQRHLDRISLIKTERQLNHK